MKDFASVACSLLESGEDFVMARITNRSGSAPRTAGTRMIIRRDGSIHGTIGGGLLEARVMETGRSMFQEGKGRFLVFDLRTEDLSAMDMTCGGTVEVLVDLIRATPDHLALFAAWRQSARARAPGVFVTTVEETHGHIHRIDYCLLDAAGESRGRFPLSGAALGTAVQSGLGASSMMRVLTLEERTVILEPLVKPKRVHIFGAGHVARPTARMAALVGFRVIVLDDRADFANARRFPDADEVRVLETFDSALDGLDIDADSFIVILTRGHLHDKTILAQALRSPAGYIGMIGSRRKRNAIYGALLREGFGGEDLKRVFSPIGLSIGAETPEEIAVSIVAELIKERAQT